MIDPNQEGIESINESADESLEFLDSLEQQQKAQEAATVAEMQAQEQGVSELDDPREKERWGFKALAKEGQSILSGGLQDTASSLATFPERTVDALSGEMQREKEKKGYYRPDWDPFVDYDNPIETKTWWGKLARGVVHFGSMAAAIIPAAKVTLGRTALATTGFAANSLVRAAGVGAVSDLISKESDGHNALGTLTKHYGWMDTPITTKDTDHPMWMKFKNIVEGMGIGLVFDGATMFLKRGLPQAAVSQIEARNLNAQKQTDEAAVAQIRRLEAEFRADKNRSVADPHQGAHITEQHPHEVWETQQRIRKEWGAEDGSTGSVTTPVQRERIAREGDISEATAESILRKLYSADKFRKVIDAVRAGRQSLVDVFGDNIMAHQRITEGRNAAEMSADEYLAELYKAKDTYAVTNAAGEVVDTIETFTSKNIVTTDLIVGTLLHQIRDTGIAGRELADIVDLGDIDGPAAQVVDTLLTALTEVKKARIIKSQNFREIGAGKQRDFLESTLTQEMADTKDSIMTILKIAKDDAPEGLMNALFETFSSMKTVHSLDDFDAWARKMIKGGKIDPKGPDRTGALIRELQGVTINSILSGPKTPARAILGTSSATFLRPIATTLGAAMTGDKATMRSGLASMSAMIEAIPESFELFKTKLDSYWSGDIASIKSRYYEFTRSDDNWEILRRWAEDSGRATLGDRIMFAVANQARAWNNNNILTYSTKLMAATDDSFRYIIGRMKAREKAMRKILELQGAGGKVPEINRRVMQSFEQDFYAQIFDADGNLIDDAAKYAAKEATLTQDLTGFSKGLNDVFTANPWAKPFFLFARTGVNGLALTAKHTPGFNFLVKEFNDIARATVDNLEDVRIYGINSAEELANAKALQLGRFAMGTSLVSMAIMSYLNGNITGNGPVDRQKRQMWIDGGYKPRTIKLGAVRVGYDSIEPFNQIISTIADIGDYSMLMGEEWTEEQFQKISLVIMQAISSKSYFAGMQQFVDLVAGKPGQQERILAGLMNNQVPLAGLRNELGKLINPYMKEIGSGVDQSLRNRNLMSEYLPGQDLPIKYDMLNGKPLKDHDFMTRAFNMFSPISLNLDESPGRQLLFSSGYDTRMSVYFSPRGDDLSDSPRIRSKFQRAIGQQNLEYKLGVLAEDPKVLASLAQMEKDRNSGKRGNYDANDYFHVRKIDQVFQSARKAAWASIMNDLDITTLRKEQRDKKKLKNLKKIQTTNIQPILNLPYK